MGALAEYTSTDGLAITPGAHALLNTLTDISLHRLITVRKNISAITVDKYIKSLGATTLPDEKRPDISLTHAEQTPLDTAQGQINMLLVGLYTDTIGELPKYKVNAEVAVPPNLHYLPKNIKILRIATPIKENVANAELFALGDQQDGLWEPYKIQSKNCFYFSAFRTETKSKGERASEWQMLVREAVISIATAGKPTPEADLQMLLQDFFSGDGVDLERMAGLLPGVWRETGIEYGVEVLESVGKAVRLYGVDVEVRRRKAFLWLVCECAARA